MIDTDTLAFWKRNPLFHATHYADIPLAQVVPKVKAYLDSEYKASVETEALRFYCLNHAWSLVLQRRAEDEPLGEYEVVAKLYASQAAEIYERLAYYLLLICSFEARHMSSSSSIITNGKVEEEFGKPFLTFWKKISGGGGNYDKVIKVLVEHTPNMTLGKYISALEFLFFKGHFATCYGGKAWGNIAKLLRRMVHGEISPEILVDQAFTLAHNTGPIFNKGYLYHQYSVYLKRILDVQRSGQIPSLIASGEVPAVYLTPVLASAFDVVEKLFAKDILPHVDWFQVEALGSLQKYTKEKQDQQANGQVDPELLKAMKAKVWVTNSEYALVIEREAA